MATKPKAAEALIKSDSPFEETPEVGTTDLTTATDNSFMEELAASAKSIAAQERPEVARLSLRAGLLSYDGEPVKGNKLPVVIVAMSYENSYYTDKFDADNPKNPRCFAISTVDAGMAPHTAVTPEHRQHSDCSSCWAAAWGSDPGGGKGKACKQKRRLVLLPTDALESPEAVKKAEVAVVTVPVMSVKNYSKYVNGLAAQEALPPWAVVTELSTQPNVKSQFTLEFSAVRAIKDVAVLRAIKDRTAEFESLAVIPFEPYVESADAPAEEGAAFKKKF